MDSAANEGALDSAAIEGALDSAVTYETIQLSVGLSPLTATSYPQNKFETGVKRQMSGEWEFSQVVGWALLALLVLAVKTVGDGMPKVAGKTAAEVRSARVEWFLLARVNPGQVLLAIMLLPQRAEPWFPLGLMVADLAVLALQLFVLAVVI